MTTEPLDAQGQIPEIENLFEEATVKKVSSRKQIHRARQVGLDYAAFMLTTLNFEEVCAICSNDEANTFNGIYRHRFLPAPAEIVLSVIRYAPNLYARTPIRTETPETHVCIRWRMFGGG